MSDELIFKRGPAKPELKLKNAKIDPKNPLESFLAQWQWENAKLNIPIKGTNDSLSTHMDLNGDGKITQGEVRLGTAAMQLAGMGVDLNPSRTQLKEVKAPIPDEKPKEGDDKVLYSREKLEADHKKEVDQKTVGKEKVKEIEQEIDKFLKGSRLGELYSPDGRLTVGEKGYYDDIVAPTIKANNPDQQSEEKPAPQK